MQQSSKITGFKAKNSIMMILGYVSLIRLVDLAWHFCMHPLNYYQQIQISTRTFKLITFGVHNAKLL